MIHYGGSYSMDEAAIARGTIVGGQAPGRNEPCPCGSGLRFKKCHDNIVFKQKAFEEAKEAYAASMARQIGEALAKKEGKLGPVGQPNVWDTYAEVTAQAMNKQESNEESKA
ncbi:MAG: hypothetical protein GY832_31525 [Chloroflexi bacterium]|nr:hypothetical protein [Chloroflexota bacterium]